jgi:hypothetical protein
MILVFCVSPALNIRECNIGATMLRSFLYDNVYDIIGSRSLAFQFTCSVSIGLTFPESVSESMLITQLMASIQLDHQQCLAIFAELKIT